MTYSDKGAGPEGEEPDFPAFFTRESGHRAPHTVYSPDQAAQIIGK
jgi:pseudouridine-5'-phosphate glycosidase